jgi:hypothetical protein
MHNSVKPRAITVLALTALCASLDTLAKGRIPDKAELRSRVNLLYRAYQDKDRDAFQSLIHPQMLQCVPNLGTDFYESWNREGHLEVVSWQIRTIQAREDLKEHSLADCKGEPLRGDATALVFISQTDRTIPQAATSGVVVKFWVHMDGTWYWILPPAQ